MPQDDPEAPTSAELFKGILADHLGKAQFIKAFTDVVDYVKSVDASLATKIDALAKIIGTRAESLQQDHAKSIADIKGQVDHVFVGHRIDQMHAEHQAKMASVDERMSQVRDGKSPTEEDLIPLIKPLIPATRPGKDGSPDTPVQVRDKLETLDDDERLPISAIKDLRQELDKLKNELGRGGGVIAIARGQVMVYDLSSQLNGVLKTFALPAFWRVNRVDLSSFPYGAFRPTTDFSTDGAAMTITFTSEIDAATQLSAGQSCLVEYVTA